MLRTRAEDASRVLSGRTALVTGANAGIGFAVALALAQRGAGVLIGCRDAGRAATARARIMEESANANIIALALDIAEPESIRTFCARLRDEIGQLDLLVHNAGVFGLPFAHNSVGWEMHLATNYLGPFALTGYLLPLLEAGAAGRIVTVGSLASRHAELPAAGLSWSEKDYKPSSAYARSKLALLTFTMELDRRLSRRGSRVIALSAHPGFANTDIAKNHSVAASSSRIGTWLRNQIRARIATPQQAAEVIVHAASAATARGGDYYGPAGLLELKGPPARARMNRRARDLTIARRLWSTSEALAGVRFLSEGS